MSKAASESWSSTLQSLAKSLRNRSRKRVRGLRIIEEDVEFVNTRGNTDRRMSTEIAINFLANMRPSCY